MASAKLIALLALALLLLVLIVSIESQQIGDGTLSIKTKFVTNIGRYPATVIKFSDKGIKRPLMFIASLNGTIMSYDLSDPYHLRSKVFLDIQQRVFWPNTDYDVRGLLGFTLHPDYARNGLFYIWYNSDYYNGTTLCGCDRTAVDTILNLEVYKVKHWVKGAEPESLGYLLRVSKPFFNNNGVNNIYMDRDDKNLYLFTGDGGCRYDPFKAAQDPNQVFGKILKINVEKHWNCPKILTTGKLSDYKKICRTGHSRTKIVGIGLRNPGGVSTTRINRQKYFTFVDVGEDKQEEVNQVPDLASDTYVRKPLNFGWNVKEGYYCVDKSLDVCPHIHPYYDLPPCISIPNGHDPHAALSHDDPRLRSWYKTAFIGGNFYRSHEIPCLKNKYIFGDYSGHLYASSLESKNDSYINLLKPKHRIPITAVAVTPRDKIYFAVKTGTFSNKLFMVTKADCPRRH